MAVSLRAAQLAPGHVLGQPPARKAIVGRSRWLARRSNRRGTSVTAVANEGRSVSTCTGISFSASGLAFPYHIGVVRALLEEGHIDHSTPLAGCSGGALISALVASEVDPDDILAGAKELYRDYAGGDIVWQGVPFILNKLLPPNAYEMVSGRVTVFVTQLFPWQGVGVSEFRSNEDLSQALTAGCYMPSSILNEGVLNKLPWVAGIPAAIEFRDKWHLDGGLVGSNVLPTMEEWEATVSVSAFPTTLRSLAQLEGRQLDIYPDMLPDEEFRFSAAEYQDIIFKPKEEEVLQWLHDTGYRTAKHWAAQPQDPSTEEAGENA